VVFEGKWIYAIAVRSRCNPLFFCVIGSKEEEEDMIIFVDDPWVNISLFIPLYKSVPLSRKSHVYVLLTFGIIFVSNNRKSKQVRENDFCCSRGEQGFLTRESWKEICTLRIILVKGNRGEICTLQPEC